MQNVPFQVSACRHCRFYSPEGRRGGQCHRFDAIVQASWKACPLAMPAFAPSWEALDRFTGCGAMGPELPDPSTTGPGWLPNPKPEPMTDPNITSPTVEVKRSSTWDAMTASAC